MSHFVPDARSSLGFIDNKENLFTSQDGIKNSANFIDDPDKIIDFFSPYYAHWPRKDTYTLISKKISPISSTYDFKIRPIHHSTRYPVYLLITAQRKR